MKMWKTWLLELMKQNDFNETAFQFETYLEVIYNETLSMI